MATPNILIILFSYLYKSVCTSSFKTNRQGEETDLHSTKLWQRNAGVLLISLVFSYNFHVTF